MPVQIVFNNIGAVTQSFIADEQRAAAILAATFTNNITLNFNIGLGFNPAFPNDPLDLSSNAALNINTAIYTNYTTLRNNLISFGQPNFFTPTNLPAGNTLDGRADFYISSSAAKAFGLPNPNNGPDGFIGIGTGFAQGDDRVAVLLHEITHAMGRLWFNATPPGQNVQSAPAFDLMRFVSGTRAPGQVPVRLFDGRQVSVANPMPAAYFSIDGGVRAVADWGLYSDASDFLNAQSDNSGLPPPFSNLTPLDPFNEVLIEGRTLPQLTTADIQSTEALGFTSTLAVRNPPPPAATTANMVLRQTSVPPSVTDGTFNLYNIGNNQILANFQLGRVSAPWQFVTLGGFSDGDTSDMLLRNANTGAFQGYAIANNNINGTNSLGVVGLDWQFSGVGNFSSVRGQNGDLLLRNVDTTGPNAGGLQIYDIANLQLGPSFRIGTIGLDWQFSGIGNFSSNPDGVARDLMLRNVNPTGPNAGGLQVYNIANNQLGASSPIGTVGLDWQFSGVGNFSSVPGESDLLLRNVNPTGPNAGGLQVYDIANNRLGPSFFLGTIGLDWQFAGVAPIRGGADGVASDLVLRNRNTSALQVYNIANNRLMGSASLGAIGADWQLGGFAANAPGAPAAAMGSSDDPTVMDGSTAQTGTSTFQLVNAVGSPVDPSSFSSSMLDPAPDDTTANMVLRNAGTTTAAYQIYNLGDNSILATSSLAQVGSDWGFVTLGNFNLSDPSDMLLRNSTSGAFQVYDIANNNVFSSSSLGTVGLNWQVMGFGTFGRFGSFGEDDMLLRDVNTGKLQVYNIDNNKITGTASIGTIGLEWQFSGIGNFSGSGTSDLLVRNSTTGGLEVYNISNDQITGSGLIGTVGLDWQFSGVGNFSSVPGESDLLLRNSKTGALQVYNIDNNKITGSKSIGTIGLDWQFAGVAPVHDDFSSDLVLRNVNTGAFQVYNIADNQLMGSASLGQVGVDWQLGGFAPTTFSGLQPSSGALLGSSSQPAAMDDSTAQLVQAMAGFGGSGAAISNTAPLGTEASQQPLLTTPQHA